MVSMLFNLASAFFYVLIQFALGLNLACDVLDSPVHVFTFGGSL